MLTETFHSIVHAARKVFGNWQALLLLAVVYAALLASLYFFVAVREASLAQVSLTFALAIAAPLLFFALQSMVASQAEETSVGALLRRSLSSFWKIILISLPLIALGILIAYLLAKAQNHFGQSAGDPTVHPMNANLTHPRPIDWKVALFSTIRYLSFGLVLPLAAIHLWLATVNDGLGGATRKFTSLLSRAFAPQSVLIYIVGFLIFAVVPYFLLFKTTQTKHAWLELLLLIARLASVFALTLLGWTITVRALGFFSRNPIEPANEAA
jgi:hypothetical protein